MCANLISLVEKVVSSIPSFKYNKLCLSSINITVFLIKMSIFPLVGKLLLQEIKCISIEKIDLNYFKLSYNKNITDSINKNTKCFHLWENMFQLMVSKKNTSYGY